MLINIIILKFIKKKKIKKGLNLSNINFRVLFNTSNYIYIFIYFILMNKMIESLSLSTTELTKKYRKFTKKNIFCKYTFNDHLGLFLHYFYKIMPLTTQFIDQSINPLTNQIANLLSEALTNPLTILKLKKIKNELCIFGLSDLLSFFFKQLRTLDYLYNYTLSSVYLFRAKKKQFFFYNWKTAINLIFTFNEEKHYYNLQLVHAKWNLLFNAYYKYHQYWLKHKNTQGDLIILKSKDIFSRNFLDDSSENFSEEFSEEFSENFLIKHKLWNDDKDNEVFVFEREKHLPHFLFLDNTLYYLKYKFKESLKKKYIAHNLTFYLRLWHRNKVLINSEKKHKIRTFLLRLEKRKPWPNTLYIKEKAICDKYLTNYKKSLKNWQKKKFQSKNSKSKTSLKHNKKIRMQQPKYSDFKITPKVNKKKRLNKQNKYGFKNKKVRIQPTNRNSNDIGIFEGLLKEETTPPTPPARCDFNYVVFRYSNAPLFFFLSDTGIFFFITTKRKKKGKKKSKRFEYRIKKYYHDINITKIISDLINLKLVKRKKKRKAIQKGHKASFFISTVFDREDNSELMFRYLLDTFLENEQSKVFDKVFEEFSKILNGTSSFFAKVLNQFNFEENATVIFDKELENRISLSTIRDNAWKYVDGIKKNRLYRKKLQQPKKKKFKAKRTFKMVSINSSIFLRKFKWKF